MRRIWLTGLVLFLATAAVFSRVLLADFVQWDDDISVYQNPHIQGLDWERLRWMFTDTGYALRYKPLTWLAYAVIHQVSGLKPFGYHLANLLLHCANTVLVFLVIRRLLAMATPAPEADQGCPKALLPAAVGALLWALNPLRVEPVARVTDLTFCLQLTFLLVSLGCYLRAGGGSDAGGGRRRLFYWCSVLAFALAMLAYPAAFAYAAVLLVLDWYPLRRFAGCARGWPDAAARRVLLEKLPFLLLGGILLVTVLGRFNPTGAWSGYGADSSSGLYARAMQAFYVWAYYAWKPWLPLHLSPVYTTLVDFNPNRWPFWFSAVLVVGTTILLLRRRRAWPWALAFWLSHLALLLPALGLTERPHFTVDRYGYVPGLVWAVALAALLYALSARPARRVVGLVLAVALLLFWSHLSWRQAQVWQNSVALFQHMVTELGAHPYRSDIQWRLAGNLAAQGRTQEAARHYRDSLRIRPTPEAHLGLAELLQRSGDHQGALTHCCAAGVLGLTPINRVRAGQVLAALGCSAAAAGQYRLALASSPDLVPALNNLAWLLASDNEAANRNGAEAVRLAERACALTGYQVPVLVGTLAAAYAEAGRFNEAIATAGKARDLAAAAGQADVAEKNRQLIDLYRSGQAYRQRPPSAPAAPGLPP